MVKIDCSKAECKYFHIVVLENKLADYIVV
jgi:hypothetical protein